MSAKEEKTVLGAVFSEFLREWPLGADWYQEDWGVVFTREGVDCYDFDLEDLVEDEVEYTESDVNSVLVCYQGPGTRGPDYIDICGRKVDIRFDEEILLFKCLEAWLKAKEGPEKEAVISLRIPEGQAEILVRIAKRMGAKLQHLIYE